MFIEYKSTEGIDVPALSRILAKQSSDDEDKSVAIVFETSNLATSVAVIKFDLLLAFHALVESLADHSVAMDSMLACKLEEWSVSFKKELVTQFVKFRRARGLELNEDEEFLKTGNTRVYIIEGKDDDRGDAKRPLI